MASRPSGVSSVAATAQAAASGSSLARAAADLVEAGAAQAAAGRQEGQRLQEVGLARAVGADQHDRRQAAVEAELAIVAEIGQPQLAHGQDGRRCAGCGVGTIGKSAVRRRRHTRIGMST